MTREITFTKHKNTTEEFQNVKDSSIAEWQKQGIAAIIAATWEVSILSYALHRNNKFDLKMDRTKILKVKAPWLSSSKFDE